MVTETAVIEIDTWTSRQGNKVTFRKRLWGYYHKPKQPGILFRLPADAFNQPHLFRKGYTFIRFCSEDEPYAVAEAVPEKEFVPLSTDNEATEVVKTPSKKIKRRKRRSKGEV